MLKKYLSLLLFGTLVVVSHSQSRDFPDKRYEIAERLLAYGIDINKVGRYMDPEDRLGWDAG